MSWPAAIRLLLAFAAAAMSEDPRASTHTYQAYARAEFAMTDAASDRLEWGESLAAASISPPSADVHELEHLPTVAPRRPDAVATGQTVARPAAPAPSSARPVVAPPAPATATPTPSPTTCPGTFFCYPRLGISGPVVPYDDCLGATDIGAAIRRFVCLPENYLIGHAYTSFGRITEYAVGDAVFAFGRRYVIYDAFVQRSCMAPARALAPLSMQTSLSLNACGPVLVIQAR